MKSNLQRVIEKMHDGVYFTDLSRKITYWNQAAENITGYSADEAIGHKCADDLLTYVDGQGQILRGNRCPLAKTLKDGKTRDVEVYLHHKQGHRLPVLVRVTALADEEGNITGAAELFKDMSASEANRLRMVELERLALLDQLTGLSNRRHIEIEMDKLFEEKRRYGLSFGMLLMDIDRFKSVNSKYGHDAGDKVLQTVGRTLTSAARTFDLFGRWEGEAFIGLVRNIDPLTLAKVGERFCILVANSQILWDHKRLQVTVSVGATMAEQSDTPRSLVKRADRLLGISREEGRNRVTLDYDLR
jgi:diguanylate cyclase (GGDEF)-like protein/PAS domain S-box-containing protein